MQAYAVCATFILKGTHFFFFSNEGSFNSQKGDI